MRVLTVKIHKLIRFNFIVGVYGASFFASSNVQGTFQFSGLLTLLLEMRHLCLLSINGGGAHFNTFERWFGLLRNNKIFSHNY